MTMQCLFKIININFNYNNFLHYQTFAINSYCTDNKWGRFRQSVTAVNFGVNAETEPRQLARTWAPTSFMQFRIFVTSNSKCLFTRYFIASVNNKFLSRIRLHAFIVLSFYDFFSFLRQISILSTSCGSRPLQHVCRGNGHVLRWQESFSICGLNENVFPQSTIIPQFFSITSVNDLFCNLNRFLNHLHHFKILFFLPRQSYFLPTEVRNWESTHFSAFSGKY